MPDYTPVLLNFQMNLGTENKITEKQHLTKGKEHGESDTLATAL